MPILVLMTPVKYDSGWYMNNLPGCEYFDPDRKYPADSVFLYNHYLSDKSFIQGHLEQGYRIILDNKTENAISNFTISNLEKYTDQILYLKSGTEANTQQICSIPFWFGTQEQVDMAAMRNYQPEPDHTHRFLMMVRKRTPERRQLINSIAPLLSEALYSDIEYNKFLPGETKPPGFAEQRFINPAWYNNTAVSLAVETSQHAGRSLFVTEKTVKPMIMLHPFIVFAQPGILKLLQQWKFNTFADLWDESYDDITNTNSRIAAIAEILKTFDPKCVLQPHIKQRLEYNRAWFWDRARTKEHDQTHIIDPILKFVYA
jgi:hypothetical protein